MTDPKAGWSIAGVLGLVGGLWVGAGIKFVGAPWKLVVLSTTLGIAIGMSLDTEDENSPLTRSLTRVCRWGRSLAIELRFTLSCLLVATTCIVYVHSGFSEIPLHVSFGLFLLPIMLSALLFGALFAYLITILSSLALLYFVIPQRNSFGIATTRDFLDFCVFVCLAWITWATLTLQSLFTGIEGD
jgi:K+-sensing histidine kinase KdpD